MNINDTINKIALEQGVEIGSKNWTSGGLHAYSGQTGSHPAYGWRHDHLLNEEWTKAVISNYAARPCYYLGEDKRKSGYRIAGRPENWQASKFSDDLPTGEKEYLVGNNLVLVSGPDLLHFHISPLVAVYSSKYKIMADGELRTAKYIAGELIKLLIDSLVGQLNYEKFTVSSDRAVANVFKCASEAFKLGLLNENHTQILLGYLTDVVLPFYKSDQSFKYDTHAKEPQIQIYNGLYWLLPVLYDMKKLGAPWTDEVISKWSSILKSILFVSGTLEKIAAYKVAPAFSKEDIVYGSTDWSIWGYRAIRVAAKVLNDDPVLLAEAEKVLKRIKNKETEKHWLVDEQGEYVI